MFTNEEIKHNGSRNKASSNNANCSDEVRTSTETTGGRAFSSPFSVVGLSMLPVNVLVLILRLLHWRDVLRVEEVSRRMLRVTRTQFWPNIRQIQHNAGLLDPERLSPVDGGGTEFSWILEKEMETPRYKAGGNHSVKRHCLTTPLLSRLLERCGSFSSSSSQFCELSLRSAKAFKYVFCFDPECNCDSCPIYESSDFNMSVTGAGVGQLLEKHPLVFTGLRHLDLASIRLTSRGRELLLIANCAGPSLISIRFENVGDHNLHRFWRKRPAKRRNAETLEMRANMCALIGACPRLQRLAIDEGLHMANTNAPLLTGLCINSLRSLDTSGAWLGGPDVALIGERCGASLEELSINICLKYSGNKHMQRVSHVNKLFQSLTRIRVLKATFWSHLAPVDELEGISGASKWEVLPLRRTLEQLSLNGWDGDGKIFPKFIPGPERWYYRLTELNLHLGKKFNSRDHDYAAIGSICPGLLRLSFEHCSNLQGADLLSIARQQSNLEALTVIKCHWVSDRVLGEVLLFCKRLRWLKSGEQMTDWLLTHIDERVLVERRELSDDGAKERPGSREDPGIFLFLRDDSGSEVRRKSPSPGSSMEDLVAVGIQPMIQTRTQNLYPWIVFS